MLTVRTVTEFERGGEFTEFSDTRASDPGYPPVPMDVSSVIVLSGCRGTNAPAFRMWLAVSLCDDCYFAASIESM
jgi:hypothetical protein